MVGIGLIGFGRVGRTLLRQLQARGGPAQVVCLAEINPQQRPPDELTANLAYLLAHDSTYGPFPGQVSAQDQNLLVEGRRIPCQFESDPLAVDWAGAQVVVEASGNPVAAQAAAGLLRRGVKKVVFTRAEAAAQACLVKGVNEQQYDPARHHLVSCSTCTANALAPVLQALDETFGVLWVGVTSVHPALSGDTLLDSPASAFALGRSSLGVRPADSGLTGSISRLLPHLKGRLSGLNLRVPTQSVNALVCHLSLERPPKEAREVVARLGQAAQGRLKGVMRLETGFLGQPRTAVDFLGETHSAVVDLNWLELTGPMLRLLIWHDNEYGYCCRVADILEMIAGGLAAD